MNSQKHLSRRKFLAAGSLAVGTVAVGLTNAHVGTARAKSCIVLFLVGGPSQFETWDPKPDAPAEVRGPFRSIGTSVAGVRISEHLPRLASLAHRYTLIRSVHHDAAPIHETGMQLLQTGELAERGTHFGAALANVHRRPFVILPHAIGNTGVAVDHGQTPGTLGPTAVATVQSSFTHHLRAEDRERYGKSAFGDACARALQLVQAGAGCVIVNMFDSVFDRVTWDCHAQPQCLTSTLDDYRRTLCPAFDRACAALLDELHQRGMLDETLVFAMGEMGRTPRLNAFGGRDHWTRCWSILLAGGGVRGGNVIGASDRLGAEPARRPVTCPEVVASAYNALGLPPFGSAAPIRELW